jgi:hypothetical protein
VQAESGAAHAPRCLLLHLNESRRPCHLTQVPTPDLEGKMGGARCYSSADG